MSGLERRWVLFHAAAFLLARWALDWLWWDAVGGNYGIRFERSLAWSLLSGLISGGLVASAQAWVAFERLFPPPSIRWVCATLAGWSLGQVAGMKLEEYGMRTYLRSGSSLVSDEAAGHLAWGFGALAAGGALAVAQGVVLARRVPRIDAFIWAVSAAAAWMAAATFSHLPGLVKAGLVGNPHWIDGWAYLTRSILVAGTGALFGGLLLPSLRRLLAPRPPSP